MGKNILVLIVIIFVVFSPCLKADFIDLDDGGHLLYNPAVHDLSPNSIKQIFTQTLNTTYIPLTILTFSIEKYFFGLNPFVFHLDNLLFYIGNVLLVMWLAKRIGLSMEASFLAALIFAIHPMKVESVAWVTERKDVLYALFYLLALHQYWSYLKTLSIKYYISTLFLGLISILVKPMAVSLPLILFVFDWFYGRKVSRRSLWEKMPILLYVVGIAWITFALNMRQLHGHNMAAGALLWVWSLCFYLWQFLFPFQVCPYYAYPHPISIFHWPYFLSAVVFLVLVFLLVRFRRHKLFIFAFFYFFSSIFFVFGLGERAFDGTLFSVVSDRFMYLPGLGICFFVGSWAHRRIKTRWGITIFCLLLVLMGIKTHDQCQVWKNSLSFWNEIIQEHPDFYLAYNNRSKIFYQQKRYALALNDCNKAIALNPNVGKMYSNRGLIYCLQGNNRKALNDFNTAISLDPTYAVPYMRRSILKEAQKDHRQALQDALSAKKLGAWVDGAYLMRLQQESQSADDKS